MSTVRAPPRVAHSGRQVTIHAAQHTCLPHCICDGGNNRQSWSVCGQSPPSKRQGLSNSKPGATHSRKLLQSMSAFSRSSR